jgi:hypothetical protein
MAIYMNSEPGLICNMGVFTPLEREAHIELTNQLIQAIQHVHEVENGYEFIFPNETELISKIGDFISAERLCCPFLKFTLIVMSSGEPISLSLTGPDGTQEFLRAEFDGAIP